jgi:hypothetical protein
MEEKQFRYQLIRYVPDLLRMEPQNIGIIVQDESGVTCRLWTRFRPLGDKPDFDYANYRKWREFFEAEVNGPQVALFQPPRNSPEFLEFLQSRCKGSYIVTHPLKGTMETHDIVEARDFLYETLVMRREEEPEPAEQPVQRFREQLQANKLDRHPLLRIDEYINLPSGEPVLFHWHYDRNHGSNERVLIEPVQWLGRIRATQLELEHALSAVAKVKDAHIPARLIVVMDDPEPPSQYAKDATKRLYENVLRGRDQIRLIADEVVKTASEAESLVSRVQGELSELTQQRWSA